MMRCPRFTMGQAAKLRKRVRVPRAVSPHEWHYGLNVELEHEDVTGRDPVLTARIAAVHFRERVDYYVRLRRYVER